jgi:hypothetical protein
MFLQVIPAAFVTLCAGPSRVRDAVAEFDKKRNRDEVQSFDHPVPARKARFSSQLQLAEGRPNPKNGKWKILRYVLL